VQIFDKAQLLIIDAPGNLLIPFISKNLDDIPAWNWKVDEYITSIFDFAEKLLAYDGWGHLVISLE
jgi:hypothetical protein